MRVLALDWGTVRIGAAVSDESGKIAFALDKFFETKNAANEIEKFVKEKGVEKLIVGNPINLQGKEEKSSDKVHEFAESLKKINIPIEFLDERFSTSFAKKLLDKQGITQKQQREIKDNIAAQLMLQQYLDSNKN